MTNSLPKGSRTRAHRPIAMSKGSSSLAARAYEGGKRLVNIFNQNISFGIDV
jgi:hypothetical protein